MADPSANDELLLFSLAHLREVVLACLGVAGCRSVVEIGSEDGLFSRELDRWAAQNEATIWCVDPDPAPELVDFCEDSARLRLVRRKSPAALTELPACDAYCVDGDHNYYTVSKELEAIESVTWSKGHDALVFLHDVGWPAGRRDMYYAPADLPPDAVHPHSFDDGVVSGPELSPRGGLRGEGKFAWAREEGGARNGVLTAVDDFLAGRPDIIRLSVPSVFGLGILFRSSSPYAEGVREAMAPYHESSFLRRLEDNRIALYLKVLDLQKDLDDARGALDESVLRAVDLENENRALWARIDELEAGYRRLDARADTLAGELDTVIRARSFVVAERLSRVHGLLGHGGLLSRARLRAVLDDGAGHGPPTDRHPLGRS